MSGKPIDFMVIFLYTAVVVIWGSAWLAVRYQIGVVPPEASIAYRIGIAAVFMLAWIIYRRLPLRFSIKDHFFMALQGLFIFSTNFFLFYHAAAYLTTGFIAVICSTASAMTMIINAVLLRRFPPLAVIIGAALGIVGISMIFCRELAVFSLNSDELTGIVLSLGGTLSFSFGSLVSSRNRRAGLSVSGNTFWAMFYGASVLIVFLFAGGNRFAFDPEIPYIMSLLYLAIVGSVVAFAAYFALLGRITAERAAYVTVLFPIIALWLSTLFEGYQWAMSDFVGVVIILAGNLLVLRN